MKLCTRLAYSMSKKGVRSNFHYKYGGVLDKLNTSGYTKYFSPHLRDKTVLCWHKKLTFEMFV